MAKSSLHFIDSHNWSLTRSDGCWPPPPARPEATAKPSISETFCGGQRAQDLRHDGNTASQRPNPAIPAEEVSVVGPVPVYVDGGVEFPRQPIYGTSKPTPVTEASYRVWVCRRWPDIGHHVSLLSQN